MRRLSALATFVLLAFLVQVSPVPVFAQHGGGGGHSGGGGHGGGGGFSGGHSSFGGGGHSFSAPSYGVHAYSGPLSRPSYAPRYSSPGRSYSRVPAFRPPQSSYSGRVGSWEPLGSWNRFGGNHSRGGVGITIRTRGFRGPWRYGYPGWYGYYDPYWYDPYWWWDSSSYDDDQNNYVDGQYGPYPDYAQANGPYYDNGPYDNEESLEEQSARESAEQELYERSHPREPLHAELTAPSAPTTLIFRDQHNQQIQNYAIVGQTLLSFSEGRTQKIPLSDLDIPATEKVNADRGVDFRLPGSE